MHTFPHFVTCCCLAKLTLFKISQQTRRRCLNFIIKSVIWFYRRCQFMEMKILQTLIDSFSMLNQCCLIYIFWYSLGNCLCMDKRHLIMQALLQVEPFISCTKATQKFESYHDEFTLTQRQDSLILMTSPLSPSPPPTLPFHISRRTNHHILA